MTQKKHLITYGNRQYEKSKKRLYHEATDTRWFDTITAYGPDELNGEFKVEFKDILNLSRGGGYWIWKYDIIKQKIGEISDGDILVYIDAGCSINKNGEKRFNEYIDMLNNSNEAIISFQLNHIERSYSTKEIFQYFNVDINGEIAISGQIIGGILIMKKNEKLIKILDEYIKLLRYDKLLITDHYNKLVQHHDFKDNRHDQSIMSIVRKKYGSIILPDETYFIPFGNNTSLQYPFWATRK